MQHARKQRDLRCRVLRSAARDDQHALGFAENFCRGAHSFDIDFRCVARSRRHDCRHRTTLAPNVDRAFDGCRPGTIVTHRLNGFCNFDGCLARIPNEKRVIHEAGHDSGLIADLVQVTVTLPDCRRRNLSDDCEHRRVHSIRGQQSRAGIEQARSGNDGVSLRLAGRQCCAERHVSGALLVAGVDHAQAFGGALEGIEQMIVVDAGQCVDGIEPVRDQSRHRSLGGRHFGRRRCGPLRLLSGFAHEYPVT